jgi:hypothetical protein
MRTVEPLVTSDIPIGRLSLGPASLSAVRSARLANPNRNR